MATAEPRRRLRETAVTAIGKKVRASIEKSFGFDAPIVFRTGADMKKVVRANPFAGDDSVHVTFLADRPDKKGFALLEPKRHPSEELVVRGRDLYLRLPKGVGQTRLATSFVDKALGTFGTTRNFRTVTKLADLASAMQKG